MTHWTKAKQEKALEIARKMGFKEKDERERKETVHGKTPPNPDR